MLFVLRPSRTYLFLLLLTHLAMAISILLTDLDAWARIILVLLIVASLLHQWRLHVYKGWQSFFLEQGRLRIRTMAGIEVAGEILDGAVVTPFCVALCARLEGRRQCRLVFIDALGADAHRELRVRLRYAQ